MKLLNIANAYIKDFLGRCSANGLSDSVFNFINVPGRDGMETGQLISYSVCHFGNDLCASMWFVYLNYYLLYVVGLSPSMTS